MLKSSALLSAFFLISCGPKASGSGSSADRVLVGWHQAEGSLGACYHPPDFEKLEKTKGLTGRKMARSEALDAILSQWRGERDDGVSFSPGDIEDAETVLLGHSDDIETVARKNLT